MSDDFMYDPEQAPTVTLRVHRYDERVKRYRMTESAVNTAYIMCAKAKHDACHAQHEQDKGTGIQVLEMRNQQVDAIHIDPHANTVDIFCSPRGERLWTQTKRAGYAAICEHKLAIIACPICGKDSSVKKRH